MDVLQERSRIIRSTGAELAVFEYGLEPTPGRPSLLFLHGYPDDHRVFLPVLRELAGTHHLITFDTRNAGRSSADGGGSGAGYTLAELVDDVFAVLEAVLGTATRGRSGGGPAGASGVPGKTGAAGSALGAVDTGPATVRLVGHDWGSIQGWAVVQDVRADRLVLDFTSVSGPDLRHFSYWLRSRFQDVRLVPQGVGQVLRSWYVGAFQLPALPEFFWRTVMTRRYEFAARRNVGSDPVRGLALYRTNTFTRHNPRKPPRRRTVTLPVHVIVPLKDPFISPHLVDGLEEWVEDLTVTTVPGGHWWVASRPRAFAELLDPALRGRNVA